VVGGSELAFDGSPFMDEMPDGESARFKRLHSDTLLADGSRIQWVSVRHADGSGEVYRLTLSLGF
jgi:hypothetical protein